MRFCAAFYQFILVKYRAAGCEKVKTKRPEYNYGQNRKADGKEFKHFFHVTVYFK